MSIISILQECTYEKVDELFRELNFYDKYLFYAGSLLEKGKGDCKSASTYALYCLEKYGIWAKIISVGNINIDEKRKKLLFLTSVSYFLVVMVNFIFLILVFFLKEILMMMLLLFGILGLLKTINTVFYLTLNIKRKYCFLLIIL